MGTVELSAEQKLTEERVAAQEMLGIDDFTLNVLVENFQRSFLKTNKVDELQDEIKGLEFPLEDISGNLIQSTKRILGIKFGVAKEFKLYSPDEKIDGYQEDFTTIRGLTVSFSPDTVTFKFYGNTKDSFQENRIGHEITEWELEIKYGNTITFQHSRKRNNSYHTFEPTDSYLRDSLKYGHQGHGLIEMIINLNSPDSPTDNRRQEMLITKTLSFGAKAPDYS